MQADFWHQKWDKNEIGFHEAEANKLLRQSIHYLQLMMGARVFLPLCGKTRDIHWLLAQGYRVAGAELSAVAIDALFNDLKLSPTIEKRGELVHYSADRIDIFVGDIFALDQHLLGTVDAIYDRAALVALPENMRREYTQHIISISRLAKQLVITFEYDQQLRQGPPFSIGRALMEQYYQSTYTIEPIASESVVGGLGATTPTTEHAWGLILP